MFAGKHPTSYRIDVIVGGPHQSFEEHFMEVVAVLTYFFMSALLSGPDINKRKKTRVKTKKQKNKKEEEAYFPDATLRGGHEPMSSGFINPVR